MCEQVIIERGGKWRGIHTLRGLRAALPGCVVIDPRYPLGLPDDNCLCCVDMTATAAKAGMRAVPPYTEEPNEWTWRFVA